MTVSPDIKVTTGILWEGALVFALIDIVFVSILRRRIRFEAFRQFKWSLVITTGIFWCLLHSAKAEHQPKALSIVTSRPAWSLQAPARAGFFH